MSERTAWPKWVTQTLKEEAMQIVLPMCGAMLWFIVACWVSVWVKLIEPQYALLASGVASYVFGLFIAILYLALTGPVHRNRLYGAGKEAAATRSLGARHYISWQWFVFGWLIILVNLIQSKRTAD